MQVRKRTPLPGFHRLLHGRRRRCRGLHRREALVHTVSRTGPDAVVETGENAEDEIHLNFTALDSPASNRLAWLTAAPGLACLFGAILLFVDRLRNAERRGLRLAGVPAAIVAVGVALLGWTAWSHWRGWTESAADGPDVAQEAREYLRTQAVKPLSGPLERLLADPTAERVKTQPHSLLEQSAPDFELSDHRQKTWRLADRLKRGPIVLTFTSATTAKLRRAVVRPARR